VYFADCRVVRCAGCINWRWHWVIIALLLLLLLMLPPVHANNGSCAFR
jgi:hypothetical protein